MDMTLVEILRVDADDEPGFTIRVRIHADQDYSLAEDVVSGFTVNREFDILVEHLQDLQAQGTVPRFLLPAGNPEHAIQDVDSASFHYIAESPSYASGACLHSLGQYVRDALQMARLPYKVLSAPAHLDY